MRNITCGLGRVKHPSLFLNAALLATAGLATQAGAAEAAAAPASRDTATAEKPSGLKLAGSSREVWLTSGFLSHHIERNKGYNERNTGLGMELQLNEDSAIAAGVYRNSVRERTHYLQYVWTPLRVGPVKLGGAVGLLDGYPELNNGNWGPALLPVATVKFKVLGHDAGLNMVYIPTIAQRVDGAFALQLKVRLF